MKTFYCVSLLSDPKGRSCLCNIFIAASLICAVYFAGSALMAKDYKDIFTRWELNNTLQKRHYRKTQPNTCKNQFRDSGRALLPRGIVSKTSNFEMRPLWGSVDNIKHSMNLLAIAVGVKQKEIVNQIVKKFLSRDFSVILFHYDGVVDEWMDLAWSSHVIHVSAVNQTKWWFAKRFLHPDIVMEYAYVFLWDEDIGVQNFYPERYLSVVKDEGLEISQPALDPVKSVVHHPLTARVKGSRVHRRMYKLKGSGRCDEHSRDPPCIGWVEMMAPVFSRAAWRCAWYMIQNDLIHAWGLDRQLGYCARGDRTKTVGIVDSEYIVHLGLPTLGVLEVDQLHGVLQKHPPSREGLPNSEVLPLVLSESQKVDNRSAVRRQSFIEMQIFQKRWKKAVEEDKCWVDRYQNPTSHVIG